MKNPYNPTQATVKVFGDFYTLTDYHVGDEVILLYYRREGGGSWYELRKHDGHGAPGNLSRNITRYHGWRGTTDGLSKTACGVRRVLKVGEIKLDKEGEAFVTVTVGRDLYPDWD